MAKSSLYDLVTLEDYFVLEDKALEKHELWRGQVYAMAGGSGNHGDIINSLALVCGNALRGKPCRFLNDSR